MADSCGTDSDWTVVTRGTPSSAFSSGTVTSDSTSEGDSPRHSVWISTVTGANSGNTSTFWWPSVCTSLAGLGAPGHVCASTPVCTP